MICLHSFFYICFFTYVRLYVLFTFFITNCLFTFFCLHFSFPFVCLHFYHQLFVFICSFIFVCLSLFVYICHYHLFVYILLFTLFISIRLFTFDCLHSFVLISITIRLFTFSCLYFYLHFKIVTAGPSLNGSLISILMSLPNLEKLSIHADANFCPTKLPTAKNVTEFNLWLNDFDTTKSNSCRTIVNTFKKMPKLKRVELLKLREIDHSRLGCFLAQVMCLTGSQFKKVAARTSEIWDSGNENRKLIIEKICDDEFSVDDEYLDLLLSIPLHTLQSFEKEVNWFLKENPTDQHAFIVDNCNF